MIETMTKEALPFVLQVYGAFPGLFDGETEVNGTELVTHLSQLLNRFPAIHAYVQGYFAGQEKKESNDAA